MTTVSLDTETCLIEPGRLAPPLVCVSVADADNYDLFHHTTARRIVEGLLCDDYLLVGHNIAFDMCVIAAQWPDLMPAIFDAYDDDRITDTGLREKLSHIAIGCYRGFRTFDEKTEKLGYSLEDLARRHLGVQLEKGDWQLRFGELRDVPLEWWPAEAREYAIGDAVTTLVIWQRQEEDRNYLADEYRQARAAFWLQLMSCWGMIADPEGVRAFAEKTQREYDAIAKDLVAGGLMRLDGTRDVKAVQLRIVEAYLRRARGELGVASDALVETQLVVEHRTVKTVIFHGGRRASAFIEMTAGGKKGVPKPKTDADVCERSGDPVLEKYAELSSLKKTLSTDVPLLMKAVTTPLKVHYESLLSTGRTASTPNVQNLPVEIGVRECFRPRPGCVYAVADYSGFELRTWAQVCLTCLGVSKMAEALRLGNDPHLELARRILGISYEEARADYKADPKGRVYFPRQASKSANFGFPGGLGIARFREYARKNYGVELTEEKATELKEFWLETWPEAQEYFRWIDNQCQALSPQIEQLFVGRYRGDVSFTEAANGLFQGLAADAAKAAGFLIARACYVDEASPLYGCRPVNFIHDEVLVEVPDDDLAHDAAEELARLMVAGATPFLPDVPPIAEPLLCRKWSKAAKPVRGSDGRLVPWDFSRRAA
jgi:DNA polymerase-1